MGRLYGCISTGIVYGTRGSSNVRGNTVTFHRERQETMQSQSNITLCLSIQSEYLYSSVVISTSISTLIQKSNEQERIPGCENIHSVLYTP